MVLAILLIVYRNPVTMLLPLITIGISLVTAQGVVAGVSQLGLGITSQAIAFMTALVAGAGTDYAVFLISRYHDYLRLGANSDQAVVQALMAVGKVTAASAGTVVVTFLGMTFTRLGLFSTIGPALAVSVAVAFLAAVTALPAVLVLAGRRGWIAPRRDLTSRFWRRSGIRIVRRPKAHLVASLMVLSILAGCATFAGYNYDDRKEPASFHREQPRICRGGSSFSVELDHSAVSVHPVTTRLTHSKGTRRPRADGTADQPTAGIAMVRGVTRPTGESLEQARATYQAGEVGNKLNDASKLISDKTSDLNLLTNGANAMADNLGNMRGQVSQAMSSVRGLVDALTYMQDQFGGGKTLKEMDTASELVTSVRALGDAIGVNLTNSADTFEWAGPMVTALDASPTCDADASCSRSRDQLRRLVAARDDGTLDKITDLARQLQSTQDTQTLESTAKGLRGAVDTATNAMRSLGVGVPGDMDARLATMNKAPITSPTGAGDWPTACNCWSTRPNRWAPDSTLRQGFCWE